MKWTSKREGACDYRQKWSHSTKTFFDRLVHTTCQTQFSFSGWQDHFDFLSVAYRLLSTTCCIKIPANSLRSKPARPPAENVTVLQNSRTSGLCMKCCHVTVMFLVPFVSWLPFSIHPPEVLRLCLLFPSPDCPTLPLTCHHFPHRSHSIYTGPLPLSVRLSSHVCCCLIVLFMSYHMFLLWSFHQPQPACLPACLSVTSHLSTCCPVCYLET